MSEIQSESHTSIPHDLTCEEDKEVRLKDSRNSDTLTNKPDINSNHPSFDLINSNGTLVNDPSSSNSGEQTADDKLVEEGDSDDVVLTVDDDGSCSRSRPYVRRGQKGDDELIRSPCVSVCLHSSSISLKATAKESLSDFDKVVLMPTPPEDSHLPALLPKHATPSQVPTEKCQVEVPVVTTEGPEGSLQPTNNALPTTTPPALVNEPANAINRSPQPTTSLNKDDSPNFPSQNKKGEQTFSCSSGTGGNNVEQVISVTPEKPVTSIESLSPPNNTTPAVISASKTVSIYPNSRKGSNIPVGIAVAWQRLVTSTSSTTAPTSTPPIMSSSVPVTPVGAHKDPKKHPDPPPSPIKLPMRPSSASPVGRLNNKSPSVHVKDERRVHNKSGSDNKKQPSFNRVSGESIKSLTPDLSTRRSPSITPSRPLPSSSVPPNLGLPYLHNSPMDSFYGGMRSATPFPSVNTPHLHHFPQSSWPSTPRSDLSPVPQAFLGNAAYLQHTMQNQMQLHHQMSHHHSSYTNFYTASSSYMHSGLDVFRHHYEQVLLQSQQQQQHAEFLRQYHHQQQHHQQQQLLLSPSGSSDPLRATPGTHRTSIPTLSPGSLRNPNAFLNPSQHQSHLSLSNLPNTGTAGGPSNWPLELYHHNSSATLSPKSLTSSTPSPSESIKKCPPNPRKTFPLNSPPVTSFTREDEDASAKREHMSMSVVAEETSSLHDHHQRQIYQKRLSQHILDNHVGHPRSSSYDAQYHHHFPTNDDNTPTDLSSRPPSTSVIASPESMSPSSHKHDFTRMESLIERRTPLNSPNQLQDQVKGEESNGGSLTNQLDLVSHTKQHHSDTAHPYSHLHQQSVKLEKVDNSSDALETECARNPGTNLNDISFPKLSPSDRQVKEGRKVEKANMISLVSTQQGVLAQGDIKKVKRNINMKKEMVNRLEHPEQQFKGKKETKFKVSLAKDVSTSSSSVDKRGNYRETKVPELNLPVAPSSTLVKKGNRTCLTDKSAMPSESNRTHPPVFLSTKDSNNKIPTLSDSCSFTSSNRRSSNSQDYLRTYNSDLATNDNSSKNGNFEDNPFNNNSNTIYATQVKKEEDESRVKINPRRSPPSVIITNQSPSIPPPPNPNPVNPSGESRILLSSSSTQQLKQSPVSLILPRLLIPTTTTPVDTSPPPIYKPKAPTSSESPISSLHHLVNPTICTGTILQNVNLVASSSSSVVSSPQSTKSSSLNVTSCDSSTNNLSTTNPTTTTHNFNTPNKKSMNESSGPYRFGGSLSSSPSASKLVVPSVCTEIRRASWGGSGHNSICVQKDFAEDNHLDLLATVAQEFGSRDDLGKLVGSCGGSNFLSPSSSSIASESNSRGSSLMPSPVHSSMQLSEGTHLLPTFPYSTGSKSQPSSLPTSPVPMNRLPPTLNPESTEYNKERYKKHDTTTTTKKSPGGSSDATKPHVWLKIPHVIPKAAAKVADKLLKKKKSHEKRIRKKSDEFTTNSTSNGTTDPVNSSAKEEDPLTKKDSSAVTPKKHRSSKSPTNQKLIPKLKIPRISQSIVSKATRKRGDHFPKEKVRNSKTRPKDHSTSNTSTTDNKSLRMDKPTSRKSVTMKLPMPKVAKLRIKLSDSADPILMQQNPELPKKHKIKRRHSDGDKLSRKKKLNEPQTSLHLSTDQEPPTSSPKEISKKRKHLSAHDSFKYGNEKTSSKMPKKSHKTPKISSTAPPPPIEDDLSQSFTSLTPPPTAKLLKESPTDNKNSSESTINKSHSIFSPSLLEHELHRDEDTSETEEHETDSCNYVSDPTFAASAIRLSATTSDQCGGDKTEDTLHTTPSSSLNGRESWGNGKLSLLGFRNHSTDYNNKTQKRHQYDGASSSTEDSERTHHIHFPSNKRVKAGRVHIKPCLKAQPIVRPLSSLSSSSDSDEDIDLEVATLTNSISPTHKSSFRSPYNNNKSTLFPSSTTGGQSYKYISSGSSREFSGSSSCNNNAPTYTNKNNLIPENKDDGGSSRRLSMNIEVGKSDEEELLDIPEEEVFPPPDHKTGGSKTQPIRRFSQSCEYEKTKRQSNTNKHVVKGVSRSTSLNSSPTFPTKPKNKSPRKRSSRSSTATSGLTPSPVSNNKSTPSSAVSSAAGLSTDFMKKADVHDETLIPGKIQLESVSELLDEMRILTEIQGLFYTGKLNALQPPDVYGVTLDNERGAPPHLIFSAEEVLEKCIREKKPQTLTVGLRICAYWSPQYSGLYPGRVSTDFNPSFDPEKDLIPIEFDDGDTGMIKLGEIRLLPKEHPIRAYDPNPLLTLEKKHRKRRHSSANTTSGRCTGEHEEADCGESFCAKVTKYEEEDDEEDEEFKDKHRSFKSMYWTWTGLGYKRPKSKKNRNKEFFRGIQRGDEVINVGDSAIFISHGNERPYIGRVEKFWEKKGQKVVTVRWFYHPEEVKSPKRIPHLKHPGALFESPHIDENDVQTIGKKCDVLPFPEFKERIGKMPKLSLKNSNSTKPKDLYYVAGYYDPYTYNLQLKI